MALNLDESCSVSIRKTNIFTYLTLVKWWKKIFINLKRENLNADKHFWVKNKSLMLFFISVCFMTQLHEKFKTNLKSKKVTPWKKTSKKREEKLKWKENHICKKSNEFFFHLKYITMKYCNFNAFTFINQINI